MLTTVFAVIGWAVAVALWGLLCWIRDRYGRELIAATETIEDQKWTINAMETSREMHQEEFKAIEFSVAERDETIDGLIARIEGLDQSYRVKVKELDSRNRELAQIRNMAKNIFWADEVSQDLLGFDQPQKTVCDD